MPEEKEIGKIYETKEYDKFKLMKDNRDIDRRHVNVLKGMIRKGAQLEPANISPDYYIQDGQHRRQACMEEGIPFRYYIGRKLSAEEIAQMNNTTKKWLSPDVAKSYAKANNPNYITYQRFRMQFPDIPHACSLILLQNETKRTRGGEEGFRNGSFVVQNETKAVRIAQQLMLIKDLTPVFNRQGFILAILQIMETVKGFEFERLLRKLRHKSGLLKDFAQKDDFIRVLEQIYNWQEPASNKVRLFDLPA